MKKWVLLSIVIIVAASLAYLYFFKKGPAPVENKEPALHIAKNSGPFNTAFAGMMDEYYSLKDALVEWDTVKATRAAYALGQKVDSLPFGELKADSAIVLTAKSMAASVGSETKGFLGEAGIEEKRRSFNMLTDELYTLINTVRYDGQKIYHDRCPMAFNDSEEGYWLTNDPKIINPYLGKKHPKYKDKMIGCGEINDSLNFAK